MGEVIGRERAMKVEKVMTTEVFACGPHDSLDQIARIMWEHDFGCVPVVDSESRVVGMVTDRDICRWLYMDRESQPWGSMPAVKWEARLISELLRATISLGSHVAMRIIFLSRNKLSIKL